MSKDEAMDASLELREGLGEDYLESDGEWTNYDYNTSTIRLAIEALEKQVPKRILRMQGNPLILDCPTCETSLYNYENDKHCYDCGRAIDWSTDEN